MQARNPDNSLHIGGDSMVFASVYGPPFVREGDTRRDATMDDFEHFVKLSQSFPELDSPGGTIVRGAPARGARGLRRRSSSVSGSGAWVGA